MLLLIAFAFIGGVITILSPCILPILPVILSGSVTGGKRRPFGIVLGFIASFTFFTLFLTTIVNLTGLSPDILRGVSIVVLILFGIVLLLPQAQAWIEKLFSRVTSRAPKQQNRTGFGGGLIVGLSIGLLWTPCVGPILASVISLALTGSVTGSAALITLAYALGTAIPMLAIMYGGRKLLHKVPWLLKNTAKIQRGFGVLMIIVAIGIFFNVDRSFQTYILEKFPNYGTGLTSIEDNESIQKELDTFTDQPVDKEDMGKTTIDMIDKQHNYAPALVPGGEWFNSDPLTLKELRNQKVVLVDFWTYSCINCIRTLPYLNEWYDKYKDEGLEIIAVHTPEFEFEKDPDNVRQAIADYNITYPVVQDNDYATWRAYENRYWPRKYLIDINGEIIYDHIGEGEYDETEREIQQALKERMEFLNQAATVDESITAPADAPAVDGSKVNSPEIYFGSSRNNRLANGSSGTDGIAKFAPPNSPSLNRLYLAGTWDIQPEYAQNNSENAMIVFKYDAKNVYMVASADEPVTVTVLKDAIVEQELTIDSEKLYTLINGEEYGENTMEIEIPTAGLRVFTFTFG